MRTDLEIVDDNPHKSTINNNRRLSYRHPPFFIVFISIFELVAFAYYALRADEPLSLLGPVPFKSKLIYNPYRRYEIWRYITYAFTHAGYWHISFTLLLQLSIGVPLEMVNGFNTVFIIFFGGVLGGALGNSIVDPATYLLGASGGCYALITAHLANLIINWREMKGSCLKLSTLLTFIITDTILAVYERHFKSKYLANKTSYASHLMGGLSGLLLGIVFLHNVRVRHWEKVMKYISLGIYSILVLVAIAINVFYPDYYPLSDTRDLIWSQSVFAQD